MQVSHGKGRESPENASGLVRVSSLFVPAFTPATLFTAASVDNWLTLALIVAGGLYLYGVHKLRVRGDSWPISRTILFVVAGLGTVAIATISGLGSYDEVSFAAHMMQHMLLAMVAPIFLALGAPVTLALRTLPTRPRGWLLSLVHSRFARVLAFPLVAFALFIANPYVLYFSDLYQLTLENRLAHEWMHAHFIMVGCLFFWPLIGIDPLPGRWPYPARALLMFLSMPIHAVLGLTIMQSDQLLAESHYQALVATGDYSWLDPAQQQQIGGGLLWASGDIISLLMLAALITQWIRASEREAARIDRQLDREEAALSGT
ncbi:MAG: cytochrome c oxidase assembly protein [Corynebacteriales bacterium]|nr:cytochrome c oxidase assembly protein [Mycobacteriales bacterium]